MLEGQTVATRTLIQASVVAAVFLLVMLLLNAAEVFLVIFGGILFAILFDGIAKWLSKKIGLPRRWALAIGLITPLLLIGVGIWLIAPNVSNQAAELADRIPRVVAQMQDKMLQYQWANRLLEHADRLKSVLPDGSRAATAAANFFSSTFGGLGELLLALVVGLFLSINPKLYINGVLNLVPVDKRGRAEEVLVATGSTLASWLLAKVISMLVIGVLTTSGLWIIGIDLALVLGVIAALLSFIPNIGPVVALIPAGLMALMGGPNELAYVVILYLGVQAFETYLLTPLLQQHMADLPPALTISMQVLLGVLAGIVGVIVAAPLTAAAMVMIRMWYVEDLLGDYGAGSK